MKSSGNLIEDKIIVEKTKQVGRLHNRSKLGNLIEGNKLQLSLLEGVFLLDEDKLNLFHDQKKIGFSSLMALASEKIPNFEIKYLVFKDLRKRGYMLRTSSKQNEKFDFYLDKKTEEGATCYISTFSEKNKISVSEIKKQLLFIQKNEAIWFAVIDEEGDITYYEIDLLDLRGNVKNNNLPKATGLLLDNLVLILDKKVADKLFKLEFFGKPFGEGLQLSLLESFYLLQNKLISIKTLKDGRNISLNEFKKINKSKQSYTENLPKVFQDLKQQGLIVKTGFKFGVHFRVYTDTPEVTHAEYLVQVVDRGKTLTWPDISGKVRLSHSVNKEFIFALLYNEEKIDYIRMCRIRP